jgi:hypothetical protein
MERAVRDPRVANFQEALNDQPLDGPAAQMQLFSESAPRIAFLVNPAALPEHGKPIPHGTLCPMQDFRNTPRMLVPRKVQQNPVVIFRPWMSAAVSSAFGDSSRQAKFRGASPHDVWPPVRVTLQEFAYCPLLSCPSLSIALAK